MTAPQLYTVRTAERDYTVPATNPAPGLFVYEIPSEVSPASSLRWRIGHHSGRVIAAAMYEDDANRGVQKIADLADWTRGSAELQQEVDIDELYQVISWASCEHPALA
jgi:hypothetical protein